MVEAEDICLLQSKRKAITALLPYAVWRERDGQPEILDTILHAARASRTSAFMWRHIIQSVSTLLSGASPRAIVLASPHIPWGWLTNRGGLIQQWAATTSVVPYTEEVAESVVGTLLQIASNDTLLRQVTADVWSWLIKRPSLPPGICWGHDLETCARTIETIRALNDVEILKSYLLLVWSEWDGPRPAVLITCRFNRHSSHMTLR